MQALHSIRSTALQDGARTFTALYPEPVLVVGEVIEADLHWVEDLTPDLPPRVGDTLGLAHPERRRLPVSRWNRPVSWAPVRAVRCADAPYLTIGRARHCDVRLREWSVSEEHVRLYPVRGTSVVFAEDLGSRNGTWTDGCELGPGERRALPSGCELLLGRQLLLFLGAHDFYDWLVEAAALAR